jgi:hypothetical protein
MPSIMVGGVSNSFDIWQHLPRIALVTNLGNKGPQTRVAHPWDLPKRAIGV